MRSVLSLLVLLGCTSNATDAVDPAVDTIPDVTPTPTPEDTGEVDTDPPDTDPVQPTGDTGDTGEPPAPTFFEGGVVTCADPGVRSADGPFDVFDITMPGTDVWWVQGAGSALADLDGDGSLEILHTTVSALWRHDLQDDGSFVSTMLAEWPDLDSELDGFFMAAPVDYDGDDDVDIFLSAQGAPNRLLQNDGQGVFTDVTAHAGLAGPPTHISAGAAWSDMDLDGDLDLFVAGYGHHEFDILAPLWSPGDPSLLFSNNGDGTFDDVSSQLPPVSADAYTFGGGWEDFDLDGDMDLYLYQDLGASLGEPNRLLVNDGTGHFTAPASGLNIGMSAMGLGMGDINGDRRIDVSMAGWRSQKLFISQGTTWFESSAGLRLTSDGLARQDVGWGNEIVDIDNDGDLDVLVAYGELDLTPVDHQLLQPDGIYLQGISGTFHERSEGWNFGDERSSRSIALGDLNDDGMLDVVKAGPAGHLIAYRSRCDAEGWLMVELDGPAGGNTAGIDALVTVEANGLVHTRRIYAGSTGYAATSAPVAHFGLANAVIINRIQVHWTDGTVQTASNIDPRQRVRFVHP